MIRSLQSKPRWLFYIAPYEQFKAAGQAQKGASRPDLCILSLGGYFCIMKQAGQSQSNS